MHDNDILNRCGVEQWFDNSVKEKSTIFNIKNED